MAGNAKATIATLVGNRPTALMGALAGTGAGITLGALVSAQSLPKVIAYALVGVGGIWALLVIATRVRDSR